MNGSALFSDCGTWRYSLTRELAGRGTVAFVGLNPSTADETTDDATIRRCVGFARAWGYGRLEVVNVYGLRARHPHDLWLADDPVGPKNDDAVARAVAAADLVVAAWGVHAGAQRLAEMTPVLAQTTLHALGLTRSGAPRHPLYVQAGTQPWRYVLTDASVDISTASTPGLASLNGRDTRR